MSTQYPNRPWSLLPFFTHLCPVPSFQGQTNFTSSYHPQTNSRAENMNSVILKSLHIHCKDQSNWSQLIPAILWSYHASLTTSLGFSPFKVLYGRKMCTPIDTSLINDVRSSPNIDAYMQQMLPKIELMRRIACKNIHDCNDHTQFYYNRNELPLPLFIHHISSHLLCPQSIHSSLALYKRPSNFSQG